MYLPLYIVGFLINLFTEIDTFYFNQSTFVAAEDYGYILVNLTFSIALRYDTLVQFRYDDLSATCKFICDWIGITHTSNLST